MPTRRKHQAPRPPAPSNSTSTSQVGGRLPPPASSTYGSQDSLWTYRPPSTWFQHFPPAEPPRSTWNQQQQQPQNQQFIIDYLDPAPSQFSWNPVSQITWNQVAPPTWNQNLRSTWNQATTVFTSQEMEDDWPSPPLDFSQMLCVRLQPRGTTQFRPNLSPLNLTNQAARKQRNQAPRIRRLEIIQEEEDDFEIPVPVPIPTTPRDMQTVYKHVQNLLDRRLRNEALMYLCSRKDTFEVLAPILWNSFGVVASLLQEIIKVHRYLIPPILSEDQALHAYRAVTLFQCMARHEETRMPFLRSNMHIYLYPFLNNNCTNRAFESLRVCSLGVVGGLIKTEKEERKEVMIHILHSEFVPLLLRSLEIGANYASMVSAFIMKQILMDELGLEYIAQTPERFISACGVLHHSFDNINENTDIQYVRNLLRCFFYLSGHSRRAHLMKEYFPIRFYDGYLAKYYEDEPDLDDYAETIIHNVNKACLEMDVDLDVRPHYL